LREYLNKNDAPFIKYFKVCALWYVNSNTNFFCRMSLSFRGDRIQWIFPSRLKIWRFSDVWELTLSPSSGCTGGLIEPKLMTRFPTLCIVYIRSARTRDGMRTLWLVTGVERYFCLSSRYPFCGRGGNQMSPK
jgi:hypothetical protein